MTVNHWFLNSHAWFTKRLTDKEKLKYLEFVQVTAQHAAVYFSHLYGCAKEKSGPLKPGVESVEEKVKTVVGPVYEKYQGVPIELLKFVDEKVFESVTELDRRAPVMVKQVSTQAVSAAQMAPNVARAVVSEVQQSGVLGAASGLALSVYTKWEPAAKGLYDKCEHAAEEYAVSTWHSLHKLPLFPRVAQVMVPTAALCSEKYNQTVQCGANKGYKFASYLPLVPTEKISKVFS